MTLMAPSTVRNTYGGIEQLKSMIGVTSESHDDALWRHLHAASRAVDTWCHRRFYVESMTKWFDVANARWVALPDLVEAESVLEDVDGDRIFEVERGPDDYLLRPAGADPTSTEGRPYLLIVADPRGPRPRFTNGYSRLQVVGRWGFRDDRIGTGAALDDGGPVAVDATWFTVTDGSLVEPGSTVYVENEQMFVREVAGNTVTVLRGVNGTSPVTHIDGLPVRVQVHPAGIVEVTLLLAARGWKRKDSPYGPIAGVSSLGSVRVVAGRDPDIDELLAPFMRLPAANPKVLVT